MQGIQGLFSFILHLTNFITILAGLIPGISQVRLVPIPATAFLILPAQYSEMSLNFPYQVH